MQKADKKLINGKNRRFIDLLVGVVIYLVNIDSDNFNPQNYNPITTILSKYTSFPETNFDFRNQKSLTPKVKRICRDYSGMISNSERMFL